MKVLLFLLALATGGYFAYQHFAFTEPPAPAKRLAPPGVFYAKERFSERTDVGVRALNAGSRVKLTRKDGQNSVVVDDEGNEFEVPSRILTDDLDVRDALVKSISDNNAKARQRADAETIVADQSREARSKRFRDEIAILRLRLQELNLARSRAEDELKAEVAKSKQSSVSGNPMQGEREARAKIQQIDAQIEISQRKIEDAELSIRREDTATP
jgi:hypothetical protein